MQLVFAGSEIYRRKFPRRDFAVHRHGTRSNNKWALMLSFHRKENAQRPTRLRLGRAPPWRAPNPPPTRTSSAVAIVQPASAMDWLRRGGRPTSNCLD